MKQRRDRITDIVKGMKISLILALGCWIWFATGNSTPETPLKGQRSLHPGQPRFMMSLLKFNVTDSLPDIAHSLWTSPPVIEDSAGVYLSGEIISGEIITFDYRTPHGNDPKSNGNWIGIWQGSQVDFSTPPKVRSVIYGTTADGDQAFDSLSIMNLDYIIGYGTSKELTSVTSTVFFAAGNAQRLLFGLNFKFGFIESRYRHHNTIIIFAQ